MPSSRRADQLAVNLSAVRERITAAAMASGRAPDVVTLVVITKNWPASDVRELARLGVRDVGENRDQEARDKAAECADLGLRWHFVGQLQTNKARSVASYADVVHSVDRPKLVEALGAGVRGARVSLGCLIQVSLDGDTARGGALARDVPALAQQIAATVGLELRGVMGVAPLGQPANAAFARFATLAAISAELRREHPQAWWISAGMSGDLEAAIASGATHVRVGSAILGARPALR
jgi:PLP dependent protein